MNWPRFKLGELIALEYGKPLRTTDRDSDGEFLVAGSNGPDGLHSEAFVAGPGIVVGRKGSAGKVVWYERDFWPIDTTYYAVTKVILDLKWAYYLLLNLNLDRLATTTGVPGLNRNDAYSLEVPYPPISEQRRIVEILDQADRLRRLRAEADARAERILPALFIEMFGDPARNPKEWPTEPLGSVGELDRGRSRHRPRNARELLGGRYPLIQTGDVANSGGRIRRYTQTYSELGLQQSKMWPAGTLCITIAANIARTGVLEFDACFPDSVVGFVPGPQVTTDYVQFLLSHLQIVLERAAPQVAQKNINLEVLRSLRVPIPPLGLQRRFSDQVSSYYQSRFHQLQVGDKIEQLYASTLLRAFSGELTAPWRKAHSKELLVEMEQQARLLAGVH